MIEVKLLDENFSGLHQIISFNRGRQWTPPREYLEFMETLHVTQITVKKHKSHWTTNLS